MRLVQGKEVLATRLALFSLGSLFCQQYAVYAVLNWS